METNEPEFTGDPGIILPILTPEEVDAKELFQAQVRRWRNAAIMLGISLITTVGLGVAGFLYLTSIAEDTNSIVTTLENATGPDAQAQQSQVIDNLVLRIDCSVRFALQELLDQVNTDQPVTIVLDNCDPTMREG